MSNKDNVNLEVYNEKFRLYFDSYDEIKDLKYCKKSLSLLNSFLDSKSCYGFIFNVKAESRMKHLELILFFVEHLSSRMEFLSEFEVNSLLLVINEALSNAVYHGNLCLPQNFRTKSTLMHFEKEVLEKNPKELEKIVKLTVIIDKENFEIKVEDDGKGFDYNKLLSQSTPPSPEEESGRGIYILKNSVDFIKFSNKGKTLVMKKEWRTL